MVQELALLSVYYMCMRLNIMFDFILHRSQPVMPLFINLQHYNKTTNLYPALESNRSRQVT